MLQVRLDLFAFFLLFVSSVSNGLANYPSNIIFSKSDLSCCQDTLLFKDYEGPVSVEGYARSIHLEYEESELGPAEKYDYVQFIVLKCIPKEMQSWMKKRVTEKPWLTHDSIGIGMLSEDRESIEYTNILPDSGYAAGYISGANYCVIMSSSVDTMVILELWKIPEPEPQDVPDSFSYFKLIRARKKQLF